MADNPRAWGDPPYSVLVVHGGPGAPGSMAPVARVLSENRGVLEPFQTKYSIEEQIDELAETCTTQADLPVILIGWSWGAFLSYLTAARFPDIVGKLILISVPPLGDFERGIPEEWFTRLNDDDRAEFLSLEEFVWNGETEGKNPALGRLFQLFTKGDCNDFYPYEDIPKDAQIDMNVAIIRDMVRYLSDRRLPDAGKDIICPVTAIQGKDDLRCPVGKMKIPLENTVRDFTLITLEKCGHYPWFERQARDVFFRTLEMALDWK